MEETMNKFSRQLVALWLATGAAVALAQKPSLIERGKYLMESVVACGNCHMQRGPQGQPLLDKGLSGGMVFDERAVHGLRAQHHARREHRHRQMDRRAAGQGHPRGRAPRQEPDRPADADRFYRRMSDDDLAAIIAYLRAQPPVRTWWRGRPTVSPCRPTTARRSSVKAPAAPDKLRYGKYLVKIGHCMECQYAARREGRAGARQGRRRRPGDRGAVGQDRCAT